MKLTLKQEQVFAEALAAHRRSLTSPLPLKRNVEAFADGLLGLLFPQFAEDCITGAADIQARLTLLKRDLCEMLRRVVPPSTAEYVAGAFESALPTIHSRLQLDAEAILAEDPAAESLDEVVAAYPGFLAIAVHRIAHELHRLGVPTLPRLLTEVAHASTGIDIHPGPPSAGPSASTTAPASSSARPRSSATMSSSTRALPWRAERQQGGRRLKRHPTIEDRVVLYANATVLGGDIVVGPRQRDRGQRLAHHQRATRSFVYHTSQIRVRSVPNASATSDYSI